MLSDAELIKRIEGSESDLVEFTESTRDLDKIREAICAFSNDLPNHRMPGTIFIGIKDNKNCAELNIDDELLTTLGGLRNDGKILPFPVMAVEKKQLKNCEVAVIQAEPSDNPPIKVDSKCWVRVGPRRSQATAEEERRLTEKRRWKDLGYDMRGIRDASVARDIDMDKFTREYLPHAVSPEVFQENDRDPNEQMRSLRLLTPEYTPTVTAILILGKDIHYWFPCAYIQFVRYDGNEVTDPIKTQKKINGTLSDQLRELDSILKTNISVALDTSGSTHLELSDYPYAALRELIRNAVIHRNYENSNTPVRVNWFAEKIEISSPGGLVGEVSRENFGKGITGYRNPTIAEAMKNMGFMQQFGIGIATVHKELKDNGNPPVEFNIEDNFISATVARRP